MKAAIKKWAWAALVEIGNHIFMLIAAVHGLLGNWIGMLVFMVLAFYFKLSDIVLALQRPEITNAVSISMDTTRIGLVPKTVIK